MPETELKNAGSFARIASGAAAALAKPNSLTARLHTQCEQDIDRAISEALQSMLAPATPGDETVEAIA